jgi:hypothetical protein
MCDPTIVTLLEPVLGPFSRTTELGPIATIDIADVNVPNRTVAVTCTLTVRSTPAPALLATALSLDHSVHTAPVTPTRCEADHCAVVPALDPTTVTVVDPVDATFVATALLDSGDANVNDDVVLDTSWCTVDVTT